MADRASAEGLEDIILNGGLRLPGFDHWRERTSSKPSDPDDVRWDCVCGYSGSPDKVQQHWRALRDHSGDTPDRADRPETPTGRWFRQTYGGDLDVMVDLPPHPSPGESAGFDALVEQLAAAIHEYGGMCRSSYGKRSCTARDHRIMAEGIAVYFATPDRADLASTSTSKHSKDLRVPMYTTGHYAPFRGTGHRATPDRADPPEGWHRATADCCENLAAPDRADPEDET